MKNFISKILLFSFLIFSICIGLSSVTFSDEFIIEKTKGTDYEKVGWNLNVINNRKEEVKNSVIFLGSSYILNGLNDSIFNAYGIKALNLAIKHHGNDLNLYFLKRIIPLHPKEIVFLKGKSFFGGLHKLTPLLYKPSELVGYGQSINFDLISYLFKRTKLALEYLFFITKSNSTNLYTDNNKYGIRYEQSYIPEEIYYSKAEIAKLQLEEERFGLYKNNFIFQTEKENPNLLNRIKAVKRKMTFNYYSQNNWISNNKSQENFVKISENLCAKYNINFAQIYIPVLSDAVSNLSHNQSSFMRLESDASNIYFFKEYSFLHNNLYWTDKHHLSKKGSIVFTKELLKQYFTSNNSF